MRSPFFCYFASILEAWITLVLCNLCIYLPVMWMYECIWQHAEISAGISTFSQHFVCYCFSTSLCCWLLNLLLLSSTKRLYAVVVLPHTMVWELGSTGHLPLAMLQMAANLRRCLQPWSAPWQRRLHNGGWQGSDGQWMEKRRCGIWTVTSDPRQPVAAWCGERRRGSRWRRSAVGCGEVAGGCGIFFSRNRSIWAV